MKNITSVLAFTTVILLSIPFGKFISKSCNGKNKTAKFKNAGTEGVDYSLRNFHPNKGE